MEGTGRQLPLWPDAGDGRDGPGKPDRLTVPAVPPVYQVHFRTHRGGCGIDFDAALTEFTLVMRDLGLTDLKPFAGRMRLGFRLREALQDRITGRMDLLGYSQALVRLDRLPGQGKGSTARARVRRKRWLVGAQRMGDDIVVFAELWAADEQQRLNSAPHRRRFPLTYPERAYQGLGSRGERRLSPSDARFLINLSQARPGRRLLDPFAGIGGIVLEAAARGVNVLCGDIEEALRLGLAQLSGGRTCVWDARDLPLRGGCVDVVVTEPPYACTRRDTVAASVPQMAGCLCHGGRLVALTDPSLTEIVLPTAAASGLRIERQFPVRRQGFTATAMCWVKR